MRFKQYLTENYSITSIMVIWQEANKIIFSNSLQQPKFSLEQSLKKYHKFFIDAKEGGEMLAFCDWSDKIYDQRTNENAPIEDFNPVLRFSKSIKDRNLLEQVVVHEMVHQKIAQDKGYRAMCDIGHGPIFMSYANDVKKYKNIALTDTLGND